MGLLMASVPTATTVAMEAVPRLLVSLGPPLAFTLQRGALVLPGIGPLALALGLAILTFLAIALVMPAVGLPVLALRLALAAFSFAENGSNLHFVRVFR